MAVKENKKMEIVKKLKEILEGTKKDNNGYRVAIRVERVAKSGLSRCLSIYAQDEEFKKDITYLISELLEETYTKDGFLRVSGVGMDMLFETCYRINSKIRSLEKCEDENKTNYNYLVSTSYDYLV